MAAGSAHRATAPGWRQRDAFSVLLGIIAVIALVLLPLGNKIVVISTNVKARPSAPPMLHVYTRPTSHDAADPSAPSVNGGTDDSADAVAAQAPSRVAVPVIDVRRKVPVAPVRTAWPPQQAPIEQSAEEAGGKYRNPYPPMEQSMRPCLGGTHAQGAWVLDETLTPAYPGVGEILGSCQRGLEEETGVRGAVRPELKYKWVPKECDLVEWSEERFCKALRGRDIMFAGDSLNDHWHAALVYRLGLRNKDIYKREGTVAGKKSCRSHAICGKYYTHPLKIYFLTNQLLLERSRRNVNHKWWKYMDPYPILVLNSGSWMRDPEDETREVSDAEWRGHMDNAFRLVVRQQFNGTIIWRTTYQGHPYCWNYKEPLKEELSASDFPKVAPYKRYRWAAIPGRNNYTTALWRREGAHVLDVTRPTNLMPLGHLGKNHPKFKLRNTTDCLHYCAPGPYDLWSQLLMNLLLGNIDG